MCMVMMRCKANNKEEVCSGSEYEMDEYIVRVLYNGIKLLSM